MKISRKYKSELIQTTSLRIGSNNYNVISLVVILLDLVRFPRVARAIFTYLMNQEKPASSDSSAPASHELTTMKQQPRKSSGQLSKHNRLITHPLFHGQLLPTHKRSEQYRASEDAMSTSYGRAAPTATAAPRRVQ